MMNYTGLVLAGAAARGAYEAGSLSVLLPKLEARGERPRVLTGTSAGALNAAFLASRADQPADVATKELVDLWTSIERTAVFDFSPFSGLSLLGQELGLTRRPSALVDTAPLRATLNDAIGDWGRIRRNIADGHLDALAIATTNTTSGRTVVFVEGAICGSRAEHLPERDDKKGIDYIRPRGGLSASHVLASAAVPLLFPPVELEMGKGDTAWFVDGGLHLNTPIKPAIELGATRIAIIATDPACHTAPDKLGEAAIPDIDDLFLHFLQATLVDPLIEDMWRLAGINTLVETEEKTGGKRAIEYLFVGPRRRGALGAIADEVAAEPKLGLFKPLSWLIGRQGSQDRELLSYLLFHPSFFTRAIDLGIDDAKREIRRIAPSGPGWRIEPMRVH